MTSRVPLSESLISLPARKWLRQLSLAECTMPPSWPWLSWQSCGKPIQLNVMDFLGRGLFFRSTSFTKPVLLYYALFLPQKLLWSSWIGDLSEIRSFYTDVSNRFVLVNMNFGRVPSSALKTWPPDFTSVSHWDDNKFYSRKKKS